MIQFLFLFFVANCSIRWQAFESNSLLRHFHVLAGATGRMRDIRIAHTQCGQCMMMIFSYILDAALLFVLLRITCSINLI